MGNNNITGKLTGKLILKATIINISPMLIASGKGDIVDFEVIRDSTGNPMIPGAGFAGMLRDSFSEIETDDLIKKHIKYFWGSDANNDNDSPQSHIIVDDLKVDFGYTVMERDGVAIDHTSNLGKDKSKYDYELIEPGAKFHLNAEITLRSGFDRNLFLDFLFFMIQKGKEERYQQGAFKSSGFGILKWSDIKIYEFDFPGKGELWFKYLQSTDGNSLTNIYHNNDCTLKTIEKNILTIEGDFSIKNSLIIRSDGDQTNSTVKAPDKTHLKDSTGKALITGKSVKGAIRHRALKILNTIGNSHPDNLIDHLFGYVNEDTKNAEPARLKSFEERIENAEQTQIQPRIKIDRFTGGTIEHALMQSQPLWHKNENFSLKFEITDCNETEAGLILLVMKDLMTEDLPVGGEKAIGRGILKGSKLTVKGKMENEELNLVFDENGITDKEKVKIVNGWVLKLSKATAK